MQFPEGMISRVGSVQSGIVATMKIIYTCTFMDGLRKIAYVTLETGIHKSPKWLAFEVVTQASSWECQTRRMGLRGILQQPAICLPWDSQ